MTTIPRPRQTQDYELLVMSRVCDLLATLQPEPRARVVGYINQRSETLTTTAPPGNGADTASDLFTPSASAEASTAADGG